MVSARKVIKQAMAEVKTPAGGSASGPVKVSSGQRMVDSRQRYPAGRCRRQVRLFAEPGQVVIIKSGVDENGRPKKVDRLDPLFQSWIAREKLSKPGRPWQKITESDDSVKTWLDYCKSVGLDKGTANRWLACHTQEEIAEAVGVSPKTIDNELEVLVNLETLPKLQKLSATFQEQEAGRLASQKSGGHTKCSTVATLQDYGLTRTESSRAQQLGRMLKETPRNGGTLYRGTKIEPREYQPPTLADLGLDKKTSKLAQDIA